MIIKKFIAEGYKCMIVRVDGLGHLCGYVCTPFTHPLANIQQTDDSSYGLEVHGGITLYDAAPCFKFAKDYFDDPGWLFGFDCAHYGDAIPFAMTSSPHETYKDEAFVEAEIRRLAAQLKDKEEQS